jgi:hypothetical protein
MDRALQLSPRRVHLTRLMAIWRSAGWPCRDAVELDLLAAGWIELSAAGSGHETLRLTDAGIRVLAECRQRNQRSLSAHDRLAERLARHLVGAGRVVWRELSLRASVDATEESVTEFGQLVSEALWPEGTKDESPSPMQTNRGKTSWRIARPDVFSVRNTSVEAYLQPMVHEVKVSRADLLSDLRHAAKRESYQWLSCETYYVFPTGVAEPHEIPETYGVWTLDGSIEDGALELVRPARHSPRKLPFAVWMTLAKSAPAHLDDDAQQGQLGDTAAQSETGSDAPIDESTSS